MGVLSAWGVGPPANGLTPSPTLLPTYGIAVMATAFPSLVEVYEAIETGVGAGTYGTSASVGKVPSVSGTWTLWAGHAPIDGKRRRLKARHVRDGTTPSAFTSEVTVTPGTALPLAPLMPSQGTISIPATGNTRFAADGGEGTLSYRWTASTSAYPADATVASSGTVADGRSIDVDSGIALTLGQRIYITLVPFSGASAAGVSGPALHITATRHDFSATKTVNLAAASLAPFFAYLAGSTKWEVVNGAISNRSYAPATDGSNVLTFSSMVVVPDGVTLTAASFNVYDAAGGDNMFIQAAFDRIDASGAYTRLVGVLSSSGVGWETLSGSMSESTSGKQYRVIFVMSNTNTSAVTDGITKVSTISYTYTMPSSDKAL